MRKVTHQTNRTSADIENENLQKLRVVFPQFVKDGEVDFDALKAFFDAEDLSADDEKYGLSWAGKSEAFRAIRVPATGTLAPQEKESKQWDTTGNVFIEGDNLEALKLLQKHYRGAVKMIYIDPPYNTGKDFIYKDNFHENVSDYYERTGQREDGIAMTSNPESNGRYHSDWLTMMYPRLFLGRNLLRDDGVMFVSIDDNEVHNLRLIMDEIFGEENFVAQIVVQTNPRGRTLDKYLAKTFEYILVYTKDSETDAIYQIPKSENAVAEYDKEDKRGPYRHLELRNRNPVFNRKNRPNLFYPLFVDPSTNLVSLEKNNSHSIEVYPLNSKNEEGCWTWGRERVSGNISDLVGRHASTGAWRIFRKDYLNEGSDTTKEKSLWIETEMNHEYGKEEVGRLFEKMPFDFPKSVDLLRKCIRLGAKHDTGDLIVDFFSGSGTTAHAVMAQNAEDGGNRKWICVQLPEVTAEDSEARKAGYNTIADIARERIRRAGEKILAEKKDELQKRDSVLDIGFKSFVLSPSNYRRWRTITAEDDEAALLAQSKLFVEKPLVDDYTEEGVVYEILVKEGFGLIATVEQITVGMLKVWRITDGERSMLVSFATSLTREQVESLNLTDRDIFVCLDSALDDTTKINITRNRTVRVI